MTKRAPAVPVREAWNTLQRLRASLFGLWAIDAVLLLAAISGARVHREAMQMVGKDTAPSIVAAQHIKSALADMDANVANELLGRPGEMQDAIKDYEKRRTEAATALIEAARNITFGDSERIPIETLQVEMGTYEGRVQRARDLHERDPGNPAFIAAYREAAREMDQKLLPAADALDRANHNVLEIAYRDESMRSTAANIVFGLVALGFLGALFWVQSFLSRRMRRTLNPALVAASLGTIVFGLFVFNSLSTERQALRVAKEDAFTSIHALWRARAEAYAANADESRYLLDPANAAQYESDFHQKARALETVPQGMSFADVTKSTPGFSGYLADEIKNVTFGGEGEAAAEMLVWFGKYLTMNEQIRGLQSSGKRAEAVQLRLGTEEDQANYVFGRFDAALGKTLAINQRAFDEAVTDGFGVLENFEVKASAVAVLTAALVFFGLSPRIREYR